MEVFDRYTWREKNGKLRTVRAKLASKPGIIDSENTLEVDTPWICMTQTDEQYSFGMMPLEFHVTNKFDGNPGTYRHAFYMHRHPDWGKDHPYVMYFVRGLAYPFAYSDYGPCMMVQAGNLYADRYAIMPYWLGADKPFQPLDDKTTQLRNPLRKHFKE
jgi:hypothetical protein